MLQSPHEIFEQGTIANRAKIQIQDYHTFYNKDRMHGLFVNEYLKQVSTSLKALGFEEAEEKVQKVDFAKFNPLHFFIMEKILSRIMLKEIETQIPDFNFMKLRNVPLNVINIARIFYLWKKLDLEKFDSRTLVTMNSLEAIIQLVRSAINVLWFYNRRQVAL